MELANGYFPTNKATLMMISGDVSSLIKLISLKDDSDKEVELRNILESLHDQLKHLMPEISSKRKDNKSEPTKGESEMKSDYFADRLLEKLESADPVFAAYEAQDVSHDVGFDFADFQDVVPRALDEVRETKEAFEEDGPEGREHYGDEIADIMFSLVNLARHGGISVMPRIDEITDSVLTKPEDKKDFDPMAAVDFIGKDIERVADGQKTDPDNFLADLEQLFIKGMQKSVVIATMADFDPATLLRENVRKYLVRCQAIETLAIEDGKSWADLSANNEIVSYWKKAKALLK